MAEYQRGILGHIRGQFSFCHLELYTKYDKMPTKYETENPSERYIYHHLQVYVMYHSIPT